MYKKIITSAVIVILAGFYFAFISNDDDLIVSSTNKTAKIELINAIPSARFTLTGKVRLSDGDSLQFGSKAKRARLFAIDSPELAQKCRKNENNWACGKAAKQALQQRINGQEITCIGDEKDRYGRMIATCYLKLNNQGYLNLNAWQVKNGWAIAYIYYSKLYVAQQKYAKQNKLGIWQGDFLEPFKWRQQNGRN